MSQHTPGPWTVKPTTVRWHPNNSTGDLIVAGPQIIGEIWLGENREANARLIAKAPEMYELLTRIANAPYPGHAETYGNEARVLLAKVAMTMSEHMRKEKAHDLSR